MLFGYPVEATVENWFHECLVGMLQIIHANPHQRPSWPEIIPETYREKLRGRPGLRDRLLEYQSAVTKLPTEELEQVSNALMEQNNIADLLSGQCNCEILDELPQTIHESIKALFAFGFKLLTDLGVRDSQYRTIFASTPYHVCPFCGCEFFDAPGAPREALDHYLAESKYPFAAINLSNLVPMGNKCNSRYKLAQDILYQNDGTRRRSYYPYAKTGQIKISLERSEPFAGTSGLFPLPDWQIDFDPATEEVSTWNSVFHIEQRYKRDILDADFMSWLREFSAWCRSSNLRPLSRQDMVDALERYINYQSDMSFRDRAFLKAAVFQMLYHHYQQGNERLITLLNGVVIGGMA